MTNWSPMQLKIECWRPEFQNWSPTGDFTPKKNQFRITHRLIKARFLAIDLAKHRSIWFFYCQCLLGTIWISQHDYLCQCPLLHGSYRNPSFFSREKSGFQGYPEIKCSTISYNNTGQKHIWKYVHQLTRFQSQNIFRYLFLQVFELACFILLD